MELEEVEAQLRQSGLIKEAVVVPIHKNDKVIHLVDAVVPTTEVTDNTEMTKNVKNDLKSHLPEYMIPRKFEWTKRLPLTSDDRVDRKKITEVING